MHFLTRGHFYAHILIKILGEKYISNKVDFFFFNCRSQSTSSAFVTSDPISSQRALSTSPARDRDIY